VKNPLH